MAHAPKIEVFFSFLLQAGSKFPHNFENYFIVNRETLAMRDSEKLGYAIPEIKPVK